MELEFSFSLTTSLALIFLILLLVKLCKKLAKRPTALNLPPGPWRLPLLGSIHHLIFSSLPHHDTLRDLARKHGPLMHLQLGEISTIVISTPRVAKEVLKTKDILFTNRPELLSLKILSYNYSDIAFAPYGNYWRQMRKICMLELLSSKNVQSFTSIREEEAINLVKYVQTTCGSTINLREKIYHLTNAVICRAAFGKRRKDESAYFMSLIKEVSAMVTGLDISEVFPSFKFLHVITGTFGGGRRMCPGISFGLANIELPLAQLLYYFNWKLPKGMNPEDVDITEAPGSSCARRHSLHVIATSYNSAWN